MIKYNNKAKLKAIVKNTPYFNAEGGENDDCPTCVSRADLDHLVQQAFEENYVPNDPTNDPKNKLNSIKWGLGPIRHAFFLVVHSDLKNEFTQRNMPGFVDTSTYPNPKAAAKYEVGAVGNLRVIVSDKMPVLKNKSAKYYNIYPCILFDDNDKCIVLRITR
jgi:N4-gp56 family major capsid protein